MTAGLKARYRSFLVAASLISGVAGAIGQGCLNPSEHKAALSKSLPIPTKDQVALVDGQPLSISAFLAIRSLLKKPTQELTFWVGVAAIRLQHESRAVLGKELDSKTAVDIARYALGEIPIIGLEAAIRENLGLSEKEGSEPATVKKRIDRLITRSVIQRNPQALSDLR